jgi:hypothetical protein
MQCSELELVFELEGLSPLPKVVREHIAQCGACKHFVEDLTSIVAVAHQFPVELEPPERVWLSIRQQLVHDKTIREFSKNKHTSPWWHAFLELFRNRAQQPRPPMLEARDDQFLSTVSVLSQQERDLANMQLASTSVSPVDTSLRQNLQQVDEFIADCEHRVREVPSDEIAREYLTNAYQQKAELLSAMMDRGGSLN